ncbi:riboflavin synthase [Pseudothermotoga thermarum]|uniref:Riboflavin synthase n=1 Tax=Pseudothermotoga thermarum DSM 5069 TaxID=688269 RepID=F7YXD9_9THEM|nr:riboflavin synthase [Pseudothermotoga thermarum]AEH51692.1 riboflavin synthase, alpha subunit [Pseudothermotoga thermarum DSM 5069]
MFTGIIEEVGKIVSLTRSGENWKIVIKCSTVLEETRIGQSIAVNGVCLTVTEIGRDFFIADIMPKTFENTTFKFLKIGDFVNLERSLKADGRFDGHIVQGHIDCIGKIVNIEKSFGYLVEISVENACMRYIVPKGSIAVDGISLTIQETKSSSFVVAIIPHTFEVTNLKYKRVGDFVNVETDIIGRYVENFLKEKKDIYTLLIENGFVKGEF